MSKDTEEMFALMDAALMLLGLLSLLVQVPVFTGGAGLLLYGVSVVGGWFRK
jgi:uncharacterized membrane-anchored protein